MFPIKISSFHFTQFVELNEAEAERIQFDTAISRGMSSVDLRYKAANVNVSRPRCPSTLLTAKRRGEAEVLDGEQILDDIDNIVSI